MPPSGGQRKKDGVFTVDAISGLAEDSAQVVRGSLVVGFALSGAAAVRIGSADALLGDGGQQHVRVRRRGARGRLIWVCFRQLIHLVAFRLLMCVLDKGISGAMCCTATTTSRRRCWFCGRRRASGQPCGPLREWVGGAKFGLFSVFYPSRHLPRSQKTPQRALKAQSMSSKTPRRKFGLFWLCFHSEP